MPTPKTSSPDGWTITLSDKHRDIAEQDTAADAGEAYVCVLCASGPERLRLSFGRATRTMKFTPPTAEDVAALDSDREFATAVLEARFPGTHLIGTPSDIEVLQRILDGGPYTDSAEGELVALGTSLGDLLGRAMSMEWTRYTDEHGSDLGLRYGQTSIVVFPRDMLIKRVEQDETVDLQHLYDGLIREIQQLVESGDYK